MFLGDT